jgi:hypothetical protein
MKKIVLLLICSFFVLQTQAQTASDAFRYSETVAGGTARSLGAGGAFGSLGADFSSASINPAGLGLYTKSEMTITPSLSFSSTDADFLGTTTTDKRSAFSLNNIGFVFANNGKRDLKSTFAIGFNRLANYNNRFIADGYNTSGSITNYYAGIAGTTPEADLNTERPFDAALAYYTYIIDPVYDANGSLTGYEGHTPNNVQQTTSAYVKGGKEEYLMALGLDYKDKLYFGATLGLPYTHYKSEVEYTETDKNNVHGDYESYREINTLRTQGLGINGKFGMIYRPIEQLRIGIAAHTPTRNTLEDLYDVSMVSNFAGGQQYVEESPDDNAGFKYIISSPWRVTTGISGIVKNLGFLSFDYEWVDYSQAEVDLEGYTQLTSDINRDIRNNYQAASNFKVGAEFARDIFRVRAGYNYYGSPYKNQDNLNRQTISAGLGIRENKISADVAFVRGINKNDYRFYTEAPTANLNTTNNNLLFTFGLRF